MSSAINSLPHLLFLSIALASCGRSEFEPGTDAAGADADEPDAPPPRCSDDTDCADGNACNGSERCDAGECVPGTAVPCDDGVDCTADTCTAATGDCAALPDHERCARGELCDAALGCRGRACAGSAECDDGFFCNGVEYCQDGTCRAGAPPDCADGIACTVDHCVEALGGCTNDPDDSLCADGRACNGEERCAVDVGCVSGAPLTCDDGDPCTVDGCDDDVGGCFFEPGDVDRDGYAACGCAPAPCDCDDTDSNVNPGEREQCRDLRDNDCDGLVDCDDLEACADHPRCGGTSCTSDEECSNSLVCDGEEVCGGDGRCHPGDPPSCDDGVGCTLDECVEAAGLCQSTPDSSLCAPDEWCDPARGCVGEVCTDDDDGDSFVAARCGGGDCDDSDPDVNPLAIEVCDGDVDEDCDGRTDCDDLADCRSNPACCVPTGPELCDGDVDEDCDGFTDCSDFLDCRDDPDCDDCTPELCWDSEDNDCDDLVDCDDSDCVWYPPCAPPPVELDCHNGFDDDLDGATDCDDPDCVADPLCPEPDTCATAMAIERAGTFSGTTFALDDDYGPDTSVSGCAGGRGPDAVFFGTVPRESWVRIDSYGSAFDTVLYVRQGDCDAGAQVACNDDTDGLQSEIVFVAEPGTVYYLFVDGYGDFSRGDYLLHVEVTPVGAEICSNELDDDLDDLTDCDDPDCDADPACVEVPERGVAACTDGYDNDRDGLTDCDDTDDCAVVAALGECCDGGDENGNGVIDEFACACDPAGACDEGYCYEETVSACGPSCRLIGGDAVCGWLFPGSYCSAVTNTCEY